MFVFAHVSDLHLGQDRQDGGARAARRARRVMTYLDELPGSLDAVLVTGDIADHGTPEEYRAAAGILGSRHPVLLCPGNHDVRPAYRELLRDRGDTERAADPGAPVDRIHRLPWRAAGTAPGRPAAEVTFLMCDSTIPGRHDGFLGDTTLAWLDRRLAQSPSDAPAFVAFHHPPVDLHTPYVDEIRQHGEERLAEVLSRHEQVVAVLCGHAHTGAATTFAGLPLLVAPGVVSTVTLPWEGDDPVDYELPPVIAFHVLHDDLRLTTHFRTVP
ncbi:metallophosphoesterase [Streptomyces sp. NPDC018031]|uniref:metallophosphoesterase n=1 Tax=Streptomyces sp. NPDC018031 TaxID=3365033 RepID=UPI00379E82C7